MIRLRSRGVAVFLKAYVAGGLIMAAIASRPELSFIPLLLLVWHLSLRWWSVSTTVILLTNYFTFFAIAILLGSYVGPFFSLLISLPVLVLVTASLEETAESLAYWNMRYTRGPTRLGIALPLTAVVALGVASLLGSLSLLLAGATAIAYFGVLGTAAVRNLPAKPVEETQVRQRMVAGSKAHLDIELTARTGRGGLLSVESPYEWVKVSPCVLPLRGKKQTFGVSLSPSLSGASVVKLNGQATDRWGLIQTRFELEPVRLFVIPRARYAAWLARKYLAETRPGALPLISNVSALKPTYGFRRGVEYYGSQMYQPGDSLKSIDWKHSLKLGELVTKEFADFHGQPAIVLINLAVADAEEADVLAYKIIVTGMSLAQENIPARLAAYDHEGVRLTTETLQPRRLVSQSIGIAQETVTVATEVKYLSPPDVTRLRGDLSRIRFARSEALKALAQLLQLEYSNLSSIAKLNPATKALSEAFRKGDKQSNIVLISHRNHDAEALAFTAHSFTRKGHAVIAV